MTTRATDECIAHLRQGLSLVEALSDEDYAFTSQSFANDGSAWSSPGAHTRHLLDFIECLLTGLDAQRVDYTARKRRSEIEVSRRVGRREIQRAIESLEGLRHLDGRSPLEVRPEPDQDWTRSTLARELQFVSAHAVHHHALIRMTLAHRGIEAPSDYGVAPSTLAHRAATGSPT